MLEQELSYYSQKLSEWLDEYRGRFVLVKDHELIGVFDTFEDGVTEGARRFGLSPFLVRRVQENTEEVKIPAFTLGVLNAPLEYPDTRPSTNAGGHDQPSTL